jgi:hypothetical protein
MKIEVKFDLLWGVLNDVDLPIAREFEIDPDSLSPFQARALTKASESNRTGLRVTAPLAALDNWSSVLEAICDRSGWSCAGLSAVARADD